MTLALRRNLFALRADLDVVSFEGSTPVAPARKPACEDGFFAPADRPSSLISGRWRERPRRSKWPVACGPIQPF